MTGVDSQAPGEVPIALCVWGGEDRCRKAREGGVFWNRRVMHILCFVDQSGGEKFGVVLLGITHTRHETGSSGKGEGKEILRGVQYA